MQKLMKDHLDKLNRQRRKRRRMEIAVALLVVVVMTSVVGILTQYGFALTVEPKCGIEEHQHDEACYQDVLVCGQEEGAKHQHGEACYQASTTLSCGQEEREGHQHGDGCYQLETKNVCGQEEGEEHQHTDACFVTEKTLVCGQEEREGHRHTEACFRSENVLVCGQNEDEGHRHTDACHEMQLTCEKEEHAHTDWCWIDVNADVETASKWDAQYANVQWKDSWGEDLVTAAEKQLGYKESEHNYWIAEDGSHKGYTRYGQFANDVYVDWDAAFVNFCLHYAGLDDSKMFLDETDTARWHERFVHEKDNGYLIVAEGYEPKPGDLVFFDRQGEETEKQMGIVSSYDKDRNKIKVIEGNSANEVKENEYAANDEHIFAYLQTTEMEQVYKAAAEVAEPDVVEMPGEPEEPIVELVTEVGDTTITLSGPASSFAEVEEGKEYSIEAELIVASEQKISTQSADDEATETDDEESVTGDVSDERIEAIEEAVTKIAEEKEREVESYQAFDIKLMLDGEEVQPLGPVSVKFSSHEVARAVEDEATEVNVIHVDETSGEVTDMEATATEENDVVIETEHFSVYVYVNLTDIFGKIKVTVEHWGEGITTLDGEASAIDRVDTVFENMKVKTKQENCEIYSTDTLTIPNEYYADVTALSKVCNVSGGMKNYTVSKVWVSDNLENKGEETWREGTYTQYTLDQKEQIRVTGDSLIRFWYTPEEKNNQLATPATFYDYDITDGKTYVKVVSSSTYNLRKGPSTNYSVIGSVPANKFAILLEAPSGGWCKVSYSGVEGYISVAGLVKHTTTQEVQKYLKTQEKGANAPANFGGTNTSNKLGVGQQASGNLSTWATTAIGGASNSNLNKWNGPFPANGGNGVVEGFVKEELLDGKLQFNNINASQRLFDQGVGSTAYNNYQLRFYQNGDTYTLQNVYNTTTKKNAKGAENLLEFGSYSGAISNSFWPMDDVKNADPHMGTVMKEYRFLYDNETELSQNNAPNKSDDGLAHNWHFGMEFEIDFTVGDYTGPMEYYFRGDDDFWLFIDGKLAVDIGGIHSSAGESLDLRSWMEEKGLLVYEKENGEYKLDESGNKILTNKNEKHTLKVFYMERGGFGSCCYMQFTLPNSQPVTIPVPPTTKYAVQKDWQDNNSPFRPGSIDVELLQDSKDTGVVVTLKADEEDPEKNWRYEWTGLPDVNGSTQGKYHYSYSVKEVNLPPGYKSELVNGVLTNTLVPTKVKVEKKWENDEINGETSYRPESVTLMLYANGEPYQDGNENYKTITLNESNDWSGEFTNLPAYWNYRSTMIEVVGEDGETKTKTKYEADPVAYSVREVKVDANGNVLKDSDGNVIVADEGGYVDGKGNAQYVVHYSDSETEAEQPEQTGEAGQSEQIQAPSETTLTVTNTLLTSFKIVKKGSQGETKPLIGAKFTLTPCSSEGVVNEESQVIEVESGADGVVTIPNEVKNGTWLLKEKEAPVGYVLSSEEWILTVDGNGRATIQKRDDTNGVFQLGSPSDYEVDSGGNVVAIYDFYNEVVYALPSTGGLGIYLYMLGGVLLMSAAAFITYRNKRKGVLKS